MKTTSRRGLHTAATVLAALISTATAAAPSTVPSVIRSPEITPSLTPRAPYTISGRLSLVAANLQQAGSTCTGQDKYASIQAGAPITITDGTGRVLGVGHLAVGHLVVGQRRRTGDSATGGACDFEFVIGGIPEVEVYGINLERHGSLQYSLTEMKQQNWAVELELKAN